MESKLSIFLKSTGFTIPVLVFVTLFLFIYYMKKTDKTKNKALYTLLLNMAPTPLLLELIALAIAIFMPTGLSYKPMVMNIAYRAYFVGAYFWFILFTYYQIIFVSNKITKDKDTPNAKKMFEYTESALSADGKKKRLLALSIIFAEALIAGLFGSYYLDYKVGVVVPMGNLVDILSTAFFTFSLITYTVLIFFRKKIENLNIPPFLVITFLHLAIVLVSELLEWHTNNVVSFFGFLITIVFFTIESQDAELLKTYNTTKENEKKSSASKQKILVNMSHEVRSPMHNILGYGNLILDSENLPEEEVQSNMQNISESVLDLQDMLENIHDISAIESEQITVNQSQYESKAVYERINNFGIRKSNKDGLRYVLEIDQMLPNTLYGDHEKIYKIITKILENSIEKTNYGEVKLNIAGTMLDSEFMEFTYTISNTGHVMTHEMFNMTYEEYMLSNENINYIKLGVVIAKKYIELLGGEIEFINEKGQGTKYIIKIRQKVISSTPVGTIGQN